MPYSIRLRVDSKVKGFIAVILLNELQLQSANEAPNLERIQA
ncbi:hypothetical protein QWZ13_09150 [Reinekea marina]|nr:hypothetical protein [Reinekea marina]MDN3649074.1 hypothetical protein [Reinekea marina]